MNADVVLDPAGWTATVDWRGGCSRSVVAGRRGAAFGRCPSGECLLIAAW